MNGLPRPCAGVVRFDFEKMLRIAVDVLGIANHMDATEWVTTQFHDVQKHLCSLDETSYFIGDREMIRIVTVNGYDYDILPIDIGIGCILEGHRFCNGDNCKDCVSTTVAKIKGGA